MPKAVIFDYYNTLLRYESMDERLEVWEIINETIGLVINDFSMTAEELQTLYHEECEREIKNCQKERGIYAEICLKRVWKEVLVKAGMEKDWAERKADKILMVYRLCAEKENKLFPNVKKELFALKEQGMKILLLSNAQIRFIQEEMPEEIRKLFDVVMISEEVGIKKPSPELFQMAFEKLGVEPQDIVYVGDSEQDDMIPAGNFGCHCIMVGKTKQKKVALSHVTWFNPYKKKGYEGLCEVIKGMS